MEPRPRDPFALPLVEVVLDEDDGGDAGVADAGGAPRDRRSDDGEGADGDGPDGAPSTGDADPVPGRRRRRRTTVAVVAAVALAVGAVNLVEVRQRAAEDARLAAVPGVLDDLAEPLEELWTTTQDWPLTHHDGVVVVQDLTAGSVRGLDVRTGAVRWSGEDADAWTACQPADPGPAPMGVVADATRLLCHTEPTGHMGGRPRARSTVATVDVVTGRVVATARVDGRVVAVQVVDDDVVVTAADPQDGVVVSRLALPGPTVVWQRVVGDVLEPAASYAFLDGSQYVVGDDQGDELVLDVGTGRPTSRPASERGGRVEQPLPGGRTLAWVVDDQHGEVGQVEDADGEVLLRVEGGRPLPAPVDDGAEPDVVLVVHADGALVAHDLVAGARLWSLQGWGNGEVHVRLGGLVLLESSVIAAVDLRTGEVVWERPAGMGGSTYSGMIGLTDGRRVLLQHLEDGRRTLVAYDVRDGSRLWARALPTSAFVQRVGTVLLVGDEVGGGLTALG